MNSHTPVKTTALVHYNPDGSWDFMWDSHEIFNYENKEEGYYETVYYDVDGAVRPTPSHSTRLWIV